MNYLKYTQYIYLLAAIFFLYDGISRYNDPDQSPWFSLILGIVSLFMFFFRRKFAKKFDKYDQDKNTQQ